MPCAEPRRYAKSLPAQASRNALVRGIIAHRGRNAPHDEPFAQFESGIAPLSPDVSSTSADISEPREGIPFPDTDIIIEECSVHYA